MQVLHVISGIDPAGGGTTTALLTMAAAQRRAGLSVCVVATYVHPEMEPADQLRHAGVNVRQIGPCVVPLLRHPQIVPELRRMIPGASVVHIHGLWEEIQYQAARISGEFGVPYVITPHGMLDPWSLAQGALRKRIYLAVRMRRRLNRAAAIHFTTATECDLVGPLRLKALSIVEPNGIQLAEFDQLPPCGTFRNRYPRLPQRPMVIFLGRLHYKKGFDLLVPAFARGAPPDAMLVIAGPDLDNYRPTIERMIDENGIRERVIFTGMLKGAQRVEALVDADLFVLPSYQENFGMAVVEALAAGCPVVISDQVNIHPEIIAAEVGGVVPTQIEPLSDEIGRWLRDANLRRDASKRGIQLVRERYDWNNIARRWIGHYERLTSIQVASRRTRLGR